MTTFTATAEAAGSLTFTTSITPVSIPDVTWFTDAERTLGSLALTVTGSGRTYTASWAGAAAPVAEQVRYLTIEIETSAGATTEDTNDEVLFVGASAALAINTDYTTLAAVKADLGINDTSNDRAMVAAIAAASRSIDRMTATTFYPITETRLFKASRCGSSVYVDRFTDTRGLVVATGTGGTYSTTIAATDYVLWPYSAGTQRKAYSRIDVPGQLLSIEYDRPGVQVTAAWGWHYVPDDVEEAARLRAIHLYHRREAPHGVADYGDDGVAGRNVLRADTDVVALLAPYIPIGIR